MTLTSRIASFLFLFAAAPVFRWSARPWTIEPGPSMGAPRSGHTATLLPDGDVLIAGGMVRNRVFLSSTELYDPVSRKFSAAGEMGIARIGHAAVLLESGRVLIAGGWTPQGPTDEAELYDPSTNRFTRLAARMTTPRARASATALTDGRVLFAGGADADDPGGRLKSAEVYDPATRAFRAVGPMCGARILHTSTVLADGRVLIAGGRDDANRVLASSEIFDPRMDRFAKAGPLAWPRYKHTAALLQDGRALVAGGSDERDWSGKLDSAEIFDPKTRTWSPAPQMEAKRFKLPQDAVRLASGDVLIAGGARQAELFDPRSNRFLPVGGALDTARHFMSETLLPSGEVLLAGGYPDSDESTAKSWLVRRVR